MSLWILRVRVRAATAVLVLIASALLIPGVAAASTVLYRTDAELIRLSERVVRAQILRQRSERPIPDGPIYTVTTLSVLEDLTGRDADVVEVWELGGVHQGEFLHVGGGVEYVPGTEVLVCLERGPHGLRSVAMGFSKFDVVTRGSAAGTLIRNMAETAVVGGPAVAEERRNLREFRELAERVTGRKARIPRREAAVQAESSVIVTQAFTTLSDYRWLEADYGIPVLWYKNVAASSPIYPADDTPDIRTALKAWTDPTSATIELVYDGTTMQGSANGPWAGLSSSPTGVISYEDPNNEISGSTLAIGGGSGLIGGGGTFNGRTWNRFTRGYVIFQNSADLPLAFRESPSFRRVLEHEIGHTIGLGHSDQGPLNIMYPTCCTDGVTPWPPAIGADDLNALEFIYPTSGAGCDFSVSPTGRAHTSAAQSATFSVTVQNNCSWTPFPSVEWLTVLNQSTGSGSGSVIYAVSSNPGGARSGFFTVGGQAFTVTQAAGPLTITSVSPSSGPIGGGTTITVHGTNFATSGGLPTVHVGGNAASSVVVMSPTTLSAVTPPGALGARTVTVTNPNGEAATLVDGFAYVCTYTLSASSHTVPVSGATGQTVGVTAAGGCGWTAVSNSSFITVTGGGSGNGGGIVTYSVAAMPGSLQGRAGSITIAGQSFTVVQGTPPSMALDRTTLNFGAATTGGSFTSRTQPQVVRLTQSYPGPVTWTATTDRSWITVSPSSGSGPALLSIGVQFSGTAPVGEAASGNVTLTFSGAVNNPGPIAVNLRTYLGATGAPIGSFDSPAENVTGVTGSIPVTGWALDDIEVSRVRLLRDPVAGEGPSQVFIADGLFVDGARLDLITPFPTTPRNRRGGWGYLLLTNFLPNGGNGTFTLHAYADDVDGHSTWLGSKTMTVANSSATLPFGAIDTPAQGETISGTSYYNFGWVLAPNPKRADPPGGGAVTVYIDGNPVGSPSGWTSRPDLTALFPAYAGVGTAAGVFTFNPSSLSDGLHTIAWLVTDNTGAADGIGSRYFTVSGGVTGAVTQGITSTDRAVQSRVQASATPSAAEEISNAIVSAAPIAGRRGFDLATPFRSLPIEADGRAVMMGEELDRFELKLAIAPRQGATFSGHLRAGDDLAALPIGSSLEETTGTFAWQPGVGFSGPYDFVFVQRHKGLVVSRHELRIVLHPKGSNRVGPQVVIDTPATDTELNAGDTLVLGGWAVDLDDTVGTGVRTVHAWAYPVRGEGHGEPTFVGVASYGGLRPDVGAIFGQRFAAAGFDLASSGLGPGTYDVAVFAWSTVVNDFVPAKVVRVRVR
ncbi:MAG TPA: IPT/TIG domain-containing protein [Vicinamibacterales bacterium]|nr:IPT/TIG domain-containing protein [Vicinamibacterales bacterium]